MMLLTKNWRIENMVDGKFPKYADGGYPLLYSTREGADLCVHCALESWLNEEKDQAAFVEIYHEGPTIVCANCETQVDSFHGDPDAEVEP